MIIMDFEKITKEAVVQALLEIKKNGIPKNAHSSTYDILYKGKRYPPKLVMEYAYQHSTGKQITRNDFEGGEKTPCFNRLKELGFTIVHKEKNPNFYETLTKFLEQTKTKSQKYKDYPKEFLGLNISVSFGIGGPSKTPWISFLYDGQKTQHGIYPVYLYYKEYNTLFLAYGVSETTPPNIEWKFNTSPETIFDFFKRKGIKPKRYGNSYVFKDYDINNLNPSTINKDLFEIIENYKNLMASYTEISTNTNKMQSPSINIDYQSIPANLRQFVTAIKSKPFILLASISGTGKSRIVRQLAYATGGENPEKVQKPYNYEMISVHPNWHDSTELLGYVTRVSGNPEYIVTDFLKFIAKAWFYEGIPFFLCLDEMNLAPVEQYFAEYLSVVESRKLRNNKIVTDPIVPPLTTWDKADQKTLVSDQILKELFHEFWNNEGWNNSTIAARIEELKEQFKNTGISIPQNLIVMGTVNMDETTYSFSRKVLDRAMTIEMNHVDLNSGLSKAQDNITPITAKALLPEVVEGYDVYEQNPEICKSIIKYLQQVNEKLEDSPFKIAYRTRNEFLIYVLANLPYQGKETQEQCITRALDEITCMKILSRIEGDKNKVGTVLDDLYTIIQKRIETSGINSEKSISLDKIRRMKKKLETAYYCDFWN